METDFSKVSLGFAEFVSQLIHETFDAILDSQNYQLDKLLEFEMASNLSDEEFAQRYIDTSEVNELLEATLGFIPEANKLLTSIQLTTLNKVFTSYELSISVKNKKLTKTQVDKIVLAFTKEIVTKQKSKLMMIVERPEISRLIVESGEIKAKLELQTIHQETQVPSGKELTKSQTKISKIESRETDFDIKNISFEGKTNLSTLELIDKDTGLKTILVDRNTLTKENISIKVPSIRLVATPVKSSSTSSLYSEVSIKFRNL